MDASNRTILISMVSNLYKDMLRTIFSKLETKVQFLYDSKQNPLATHVKSKLPTSFKPCKFISRPLVQMALHRMIYGAKKIMYTRRTTKFRDGLADCHLDILMPHDHDIEAHPSKVLFVCHGLGGSSASSYCKNIALNARRLGWTTVIYNRRGHASKNEGHYPTHYDPDDMCDALEFVKVVFKGGIEAILGVGYSLGANLLVKYTGEHPNKHPFKAIISVGNGFDLQVGVAALSIIDPLADQISGMFVAKIISNHEKLQKNKDIQAQLALYKRFIDIDTYIMQMTKGMDFNMENYYKNASSANAIANINIPILAIASKDDPFVMSGMSYYIDGHVLNPSNWCSLLTNHGGHIGWLEGIRCASWLDQVICTFADSVLSYT
jgi:predicted alpha/beta-fold hydrolase